MIFNSIEYLLFLPIVFILYWFVLDKLRWQNLLLLLASFIFYGWWNWHFLVLIVITIICSFISGILIEHCEKRYLRRIFCLINIVINISILGVYKYYNFFIDSFIDICNFIGVQVHVHSLQLILPVGISFYTFQALGYSIDVYKNKIKPSHDIVEYSVFICFFPQLVAGPIERAGNLLSQFQSVRTFNYSTAIDGVKQILWGLFKKMVVADNCAVVANAIFENPGNYSSFALLIGAVMFSFQIYGDFSGYSDIAIGSAKLLGIKLTRNFNFPYFSVNIDDFWRRWHISLNRWFIDYIYIPMGGNRCGELKTHRNIFVVFLLSGLWHGANWTFVLWGAYNAILLSFHRILDIRIKKLEIIYAFRLIITFFLIVMGWIVFRSNSISDAIVYFTRLFSMVEGMVPLKMDSRAVVAIFILLIIEWIYRHKEYGLQMELSNYSPMSRRIIQYCIFSILFFVTIIFSGAKTDFIYFQF